MALKHTSSIFLSVLLASTVCIVTAFVHDQQSCALTQTIINKPYYYVNQLSNVDTSPDKGTHSNFTAMASNPDNIFNTLTETGASIGSDTFGSSIGSSSATVAANRMVGSVFTSPANAQGAFLRNITWYGRGDSSSGFAKAVLVLHSTMQIVAVSNPVSFTTTATEYTCVFASPPTLSASTEYVLMMICSVQARFYYAAGSSNQGHVDSSNSYSSPTNPTDATHNNNKYRIRAAYDLAPNYELDLEVQWVNVDYGETNEMLCIFAGDLGTESLRVDVWTGSGWNTVISALIGGWNNVSVSAYLASSTFTVRFKGTAEVNDNVQDGWKIDVATLHLWS